MGKRSISRKTIAKGVTAGVTVIASLGILQMGEYMLPPEPVVQTEPAEAAVPEESEVQTEIVTEAEVVQTELSSSDDEDDGSGVQSFTPGTYTAAAKGISSDITVTCTFDETSMTAMTADVSGETAGIGAEIGDQMVSSVLSAQSAEVDGIAGATITSDAVKAAVADCIAQASSGDEELEEDNLSETENGTDEIIEEETEIFTEVYTELLSGDAGTAGTEEVSEDLADADGTETVPEDTDETEEVSEVSEGTDGTEAASDGGSYTPGTYTATAPGISSDITVTCTFDEAAMTSVSVDVSGETQGIGADIGDGMEESILLAQSAEVDGVTGATITSNAVKSATADCFAQAGAGASSDSTAPAETESEAASEAETGAVSEIASEDETEMASETASEIETETEMASAAASEIETETEMASAAASENGTGAETEGETENESEASVSGYVPGSYTAAAPGISSDVSVTLEFSETALVSAEIDVSGETAGIGAEIGDEVIQQLIDAQSAEIDGVSGATITSDAIKTAAESCIEQALAADSANESTEAETVAETETESEAAAEAETETESDAATDAETGAELEAGTETTSEAGNESDAGNASAQSGTSTASGAYTPGVYIAFAKGINGNVTAACSFDETRLVAIGLDVSGETPDIGGAISDEMCAAILAAQSPEVDGVSGATITSDAVIAAVSDCFAQASGAK